MENETDRLQHFVLSLIFILYTSAMTINVIQTLAGKAELARHHFIPFFLASYAWWESVPAENKRRLWAVIRAIVVAVAKAMLSLLKTLASLPALFVRALVANYQEA